MLRMRLLGSFDLRGPNDRPLKITARKTRALLAFLALQNGAPQSRERLAALLWEDADAELARSSLRQALTALRRALPAKLHALVEADAQQVALNLAQVQVDVHQLRALLAEATVESLQAARKLGAEPLLEGFDARSGSFEEWAAAERRTLRRDLAAAAAKLAALCRDAADADGEIDALNWLLTLEPLAEGAHRELMACYARAGRYTEALRQYQLLRTVLRRELDLAPDPATEALYRDLMKKRRAGASGPLYALPGAEPEDEVAAELAAGTRRAGLRRRSRAADGRRARDAPARPRRATARARPRGDARAHAAPAAAVRRGCRAARRRRRPALGRSPGRGLRPREPHRQRTAAGAARRAGDHPRGRRERPHARRAGGRHRAGRVAADAHRRAVPALGRPDERRRVARRAGESGRGAALRRPAPRARGAQPAVRRPPGRVVADELAARALRGDAARAHHRHARRRRHRQDAPARGAHGRRARARHRLSSRAGARLRPGEGAPPAGRAVREPARRRGRRRAGGARARGRSRRSSPAACRPTASCTRAAWSARRCPRTRPRSSATWIRRRSSTAA